MTCHEAIINVNSTNSKKWEVLIVLRVVTILWVAVLDKWASDSCCLFHTA